MTTNTTEIKVAETVQSILASSTSATEQQQALEKFLETVSNEPERNNLRVHFRIAQMKAQIAAEEAALEAERQRIRKEEEELERQERFAAAKVKQQKTIEQLRPHMVAVQAELLKLGVAVTVREGDAYKNTMPSLNMAKYSYTPQFQERYESSSYTFRQGRMIGWSIKVGLAGDGVKTFPQKKDGTFNYAKIAEDIHRRMVCEQREEQQRQARMQTANKGEVIAKALGANLVNSGYDNRGRWEAKAPVVTMSVDKAEELYLRLEAAELKAKLYDGRLDDDKAQNEEVVN